MLAIFIYFCASTLAIPMLIDLDNQQQLPSLLLHEHPFLSQITFALTPDLALPAKLTKIQPLLPFLSARPLIKTAFQLRHPPNLGFPHEVAAVGGTFDHMHLGHQVLLLYTALSANSLIYIGVTGEQLLAKKKSKELLESWEIRRNNVQAFVSSIRPDLKVNIFELNDPFGVTILEPNIDALVISEETLGGGEKVNQVRAERGMHGLKLITCPTISPSNDVESKISSSSIREYLLRKNSLTTEQYAGLRQTFKAVAAEMGAVSAEKVEGWWARLFLGYSEHWRHYHTNQHIFNMLHQWNGHQFAERKNHLARRDAAVVEISIFFHDAVYRPDSKTNEEDSAELASLFIRDILGDSEAASQLSSEVSVLILETKAHEPSNALSRILYDLDMGILNSEPKQYQEYARGIRQEYEPLFGKEYSTLRMQLLQKWKQDKHYFTFQPQNLLSNLSWELQALENHSI